MIQRPVAVGLKVCEGAIVDLRTRHVTLVNCYRKLRFREFPTRPRSFRVCAVLSLKTDFSPQIHGRPQMGRCAPRSEASTLILYIVGRP